MNVQVAGGAYVRKQIQQVSGPAKMKHSFVAKFLRKLNSQQAETMA